ncbi:MAG: hypothetical protein ACRC0L_12470, partial [Angustibacter sp.]
MRSPKASADGNTHTAAGTQATLHTATTIATTTGFTSASAARLGNKVKVTSYLDRTIGNSVT